MPTLDYEEDRYEAVSSRSTCYENELNNFFSFKTFANGVYWSHPTSCGEDCVFMISNLKGTVILFATSEYHYNNNKLHLISVVLISMTLII